MVVDTSALVAFILDEDDADWFEGKLVSSEGSVISGTNFVEAEIVLRRRGRGADRLLDSTLTRFDVGIAAVTVEQAHIAGDAFGQYGKGSGHPAQLNFGDCFAYALATALRAPLLFKGNDFVHTDVKRA